jgi:hypothetical protein
MVYRTPAGNRPGGMGNHRVNREFFPEKTFTGEARDGDQGHRVRFLRVRFSERLILYYGHCREKTRQ